MTQVKKTGIKIHIAVDILGFPYAIAITTANVTDRDGAVIMFKEMIYQLPRLKTVLCDGAYTGENFSDKIFDLLFANVQVAKRPDLHKFTIIPKRWIVERTFGWLDKCRRLWKNCERLLSSSLAMIKFAFIAILLNRV
jgi:transposase